MRRAPTSRMQIDVLRHLQAGRTLTQDQAKLMYGIGRVSSQVNRLRKRGFTEIKTRTITVQNRFGEDVDIGEYYIPTEQLSESFRERLLASTDETLQTCARVKAVAVASDTLFGDAQP